MFSRLTERLEVDMSMENLLPTTAAGYRPIHDTFDDSSFNGPNGNPNPNNGNPTRSSFFQLSSPFHNDNGDNDNNSDSNSCLSDFCPSLTWQERLGGCLACMLLGYVLSLGSFFRMKDVFLGKPGSYRPFVTYSTVGNILSLSGSFFLSGPQSQWKKMFHDSRKIATILYLSSLAVTLLVCLSLPSRRDDDGGGSDSENSNIGSGSWGVKFEGILLLILLACQYISVAWYCLSYIPFARQLAKKMVGNMMHSMDAI